MVALILGQLFCLKFSIMIQKLTFSFLKMSANVMFLSDEANWKQAIWLWRLVYFPQIRQSNEFSQRTLCNCPAWAKSNFTFKKLPGSYFWKTLFELSPCSFTRKRLSNKLSLGIYVNSSFASLEHLRPAPSTRNIKKRCKEKEKALKFETLFTSSLSKLVTEGWKFLTRYQTWFRRFYYVLCTIFPCVLKIYYLHFNLV